MFGATRPTAEIVAIVRADFKMRTGPAKESGEWFGWQAGHADCQCCSA